MEFTLTQGQPISNEIKSKIENVTEKINDYSNLHEAVYNDGIFTNVSLDLGIPYYIQHVETGGILQIDADNNIILTRENLNMLTERQMWNIKKTDEMPDTLSYTITSNKTNNCLSYVANTLTTGSVYQLKMMECINNNSSWSIIDNNSYKSLLIKNDRTKTLDFSNNSLNISDFLIETNNYQIWIIKPTPAGLKQMRTNISNEVNDIYNLVKKIMPNKTNFQNAIALNVNKLTETMNKLEEAEELYRTKKQKLEEETPNYDSEILEGNYQTTLLTSNSSFYRYIVYLFFSIFVIGSVIFIYMKPEESNLDMFMLAFAISILLYYIYDYYKGKMNI